jgi:hypothetical protein
MKVSHEVPLCLLEDSKKFNDYDYCLPHLLDEEPGYLNYFLQAKSEGRYIIMDNSLHELGKAYDTERLLHWIYELEPDEFIVPDVWEDMEGSIENAKLWIDMELPPNVEKVVVVQAQTLHEAFECTKIYKELGYKKICYSYGASYYNTVCLHPNQDLGKALGRLFVISVLYNQGVLTENDRVHLLGCAVPQEFGWYEGIKCIESIDTSNPIMAALDNVSYNTSGLTSKPKSNMNENFDMLYDELDYECITHNVEMFRKINNIKKQNNEKRKNS